MPEYKAKRYDKYTLTPDEYNTVKEQVISVLRQYNDHWTPQGVDAMLQKWMKNKGELIAAFKEHPNYNGNLQLVFSNETYVSNTSKTAGGKFVEWLKGKFDPDDLRKETVILGKTLKEYKAMERYMVATTPMVVPIIVGDTFSLMNYDLYEQRTRELEKIRFTLSLFKGNRYTIESLTESSHCHALIDWISNWESDRLDNNMAVVINRRLPDIKAREGQRTTKIVGKIARHYGWDNLDGYVKAYTDYCDAINIISVTRHTVLSVHPADYLTMSFGNSWSSCHTIDKANIRNAPNGYAGQYASGTVSYMCDGCSMVLYTVDKSYEGNTFFEQNKINRCMFHAMNERIVQGRCYPQTEDNNSGLYTQFRTLVQKVFSEIWEIPNIWTIKRGCLEDVIVTYGTHYPDYIEFDTANMSTFKYTSIPDDFNVVKIGHNPIDVCTGEIHSRTERLYVSGRFCSSCGAYIEEYELGNNCVVRNGEVFHVNCCVNNERSDTE